MANAPLWGKTLPAIVRKVFKILDELQRSSAYWSLTGNRLLAYGVEMSSWVTKASSFIPTFLDG